MGWVFVFIGVCVLFSVSPFCFFYDGQVTKMGERKNHEFGWANLCSILLVGHRFEGGEIPFWENFRVWHTHTHLGQSNARGVMQREAVLLLLPDRWFFHLLIFPIFEDWTFFAKPANILIFYHRAYSHGFLIGFFFRSEMIQIHWIFNGRKGVVGVAFSRGRGEIGFRERRKVVFLWLWLVDSRGEKKFCFFSSHVDGGFVSCCSPCLPCLAAY